MGNVRDEVGRLEGLIAYLRRSAIAHLEANAHVLEKWPFAISVDTSTWHRAA